MRVEIRPTECGSTEYRLDFLLTFYRSRNTYDGNLHQGIFRWVLSAGLLRLVGLERFQDFIHHFIFPIEIRWPLVLSKVEPHPVPNPERYRTAPKSPIRASSAVPLLS